jgi:hypothetical protein
MQRSHVNNEQNSIFTSQGKGVEQNHEKVVGATVIIKIII